MVTTISNAKLIENHQAVDGKTLHDELSIKIRKVFAEDLSDQEIENAVNQCSVGRKYIIEFPVSDIFEKEHEYDIDNVIRMSPLFESVCRLVIFYKEKIKFARVWLKGDIRKFLPKGHKHYKS